MSYCPRCGSEVSDDDKFCTKCGNQLTHEERIIKRHFFNQKFIAIFAAGVAVVIAIVAFLFSHKPTVNLDSYVEIQYEGYDGYGSYMAYIDWARLEKDYSGKIKYKNAAKNEYGAWISVLTPIEALNDFVHITDNYGVSTASNGDVFTYHWDVDLEKVNELFKVKLKYKDTERKLEGFQEVEKYDVFDNLEVSFSGYAPKAKLSMQYIGDDLSSDSFSSDKETDLENGDVVKITVNESAIEKMIRNTGKTPKYLEKTFEVTGLPSYVTEYSDIPEGLVNIISEQAKDYFRSYAEKPGKSEFKNLEYLGSYFLVAKDFDYSDDNPFNYYICAYKLTVHLHDEAKSYKLLTFDKDVPMYVAYACDSLCVDENGQLIGTPQGYFARTLSDTVIVEGGTLLKTWGFPGAFDSKEKLYDRLVLENEEIYTHVEQEEIKDSDQADNSSADASDISSIDDGKYNTYAGMVTEISLNDGYITISAARINKDEFDTMDFTSVTLPVDPDIEYGDIDADKQFENNSDFETIKERCDNETEVDGSPGVYFIVKNGKVTRLYLMYS